MPNPTPSSSLLPTRSHHLTDFRTRLSCGHSACFVCVRLLLETQWGCDECGQVVTRRPQLDVEEVATIERAYPGWDQSKIAFGWEGLSFPAARR
jgi:hypothetical protein